jgi:NAD(P)H-hydrate epimerase
MFLEHFLDLFCLMKIFTAAQIKACDAYTIHASGITSVELMERAAGKCAEWLMLHMPKDAVYIVLCGTGNNGGDGLALTRMLNRQGYGAKAFLLHFSPELSDDCRANLARLQNIDAELISILQSGSFITDIPSNIIIIDAILGTGLNRPAEGWVAEFITHINQLPNKKIAIDIPSGMPADNIPDNEAPILKAEHTLSFQFYKRSFLHPEMGRLAGDVHILDIGLHKTFISSTQTNYQTIDIEKIKELYKPRDQFSNKGTYGDALLVGGSYGMMGAITLAAKAALRAGAGKVKAFIPECGYNIIQTAVPEAMCQTKGEKHITSISGWNEAKAIGIGPGLGTQEYTARAFTDFIQACKQPVVIDADGLNLLAKQPELLHKLPEQSVLTPHPKEFERLFGKSTNSMQQLEQARTQAMRYNIYIALKGHYTAAVTPEGECWYNTTGNAGMATGGSGDVLTGILTGLMAQGYNSYEAVLLSVYLHGLAGDIAAATHSQEAMIAGDIIDNLGKAFLTIS